MILGRREGERRKEDGRKKHINGLAKVVKMQGRREEIKAWMRGEENKEEEREAERRTGMKEERESV